jgi:hypothetical protein
VADAAAQLAVIVERDEGAARFVQDLGRPRHMRRCHADVRGEGFSGQTQQKLSIVFAGHSKTYIAEFRLQSSDSERHLKCARRNLISPI